jgi:hypothetical protein
MTSTENTSKLQGLNVNFVYVRASWNPPVLDSGKPSLNKSCTSTKVERRKDLADLSGYSYTFPLHGSFFNVDRKHSSVLFFLY